MSDPAATPLATSVPDTARPGEDRPSRFGRLLGLVRKLVDYGKELATTLQQRATATTPDDAALRPFGTRDIGLILARITRGLLRACALEARVVELAARPEASPARPRAPAQRAPRASRPAAPTPTTDEADPRLARLPTPEQIAAEVRRRPIGAVIADICGDLGILPSHPLWVELSVVIVRYGGSLGALFKDIADRLCPLPRPSRSLATPAAVPAPAAAGTGPP